MIHLFFQLYVNGITWLDPSLRNVDYIAQFKAELRKEKDISHVPKHCEIGPQKLNIILTQLWCVASFLNYDLFQVDIISDPSCRCVAVEP